MTTEELKTLKTHLCYRFVKDDMTSESGTMSWKINEWNKVEGKIKCCESGLHASMTPLQSLNNIYGNRWFVAEYKGKIDEQDNKFCASQMRLLKEIPIIVIKRFAIFCAKDCLKNYEKEYPNDKRVSDAIKAAEDYLDGKINLHELSAAESAAWSAARSAAESAAWSAESAAWSAAESAAWSAAESAAKSAAWSAAESAAWSAAESAAWSAAEKRQEKELKRLIKEYVK